MRRRIRLAIGAGAAGSLIVCAWHGAALAQFKSDFPDGYDAVQAAPDSHKVIFENGLVRVLQVAIPPTGKTEPMHHHHWPSIFISWDTGGKTSHIRYHTADGHVRDSPTEVHPLVPGHWSVRWMSPEPMHAIEAVENNGRTTDIPLLRVEIKVANAGG